jgi:hypothetical protein
LLAHDKTPLETWLALRRHKTTLGLPTGIANVLLSLGLGDLWIIENDFESMDPRDALGLSNELFPIVAIYIILSTIGNCE